MASSKIDQIAKAAKIRVMLGLGLDMKLSEAEAKKKGIKLYK